MFIIALYFEQVLFISVSLEEGREISMRFFPSHLALTLSIYVTFNPQLKARITSHKAQSSGNPNLTVT